jgi:tartrate-resistant acid phosphatase type 5
MKRSVPRLLLPLAGALALVACPSSEASPPKAAARDAGPASPAAAPPGSADVGVGSVRFIAVGDTGKGTPQQAQVGRAIGQVCAAQGCDFVVLLGDNFYPSGVSSTDDPKWDTAFVTPYAPVAAPFYAVLGNHDYGGDGSGAELEKGAVQVAYSKVNPKWRMPATHYRWSLRGVDFFAADTNRSMYHLDDAVRADFSAWLGASTATWKLVFGHHPLRSNGPHGNAGRYDGVPLVPIANGAGVQRFVEEQVCGRADLYVAGHEHSLQWLQGGCTREGSRLETELIVSGAGSSPTGLREPPRNPHHFQRAALGFLYVVVDGATLTGTFHDGDGQPQFTRTLTKARAATPVTGPR